MKSPRVFISYSHLDWQHDPTWLKGFAEALKAAGAAVWLDVDAIAAGDHLRVALEHALRNSDAVAFILSKSSGIQSPSLMFEIGAAIGMNKRLIPIVEPGLSLAEIPLDLRLRRWINRSEPEETAHEVASALGLSGRVPSAASAH